MNKTTTLDLIFYAYNEADLKDSDRIQRSIDGDPLMQNDYNELLATLSSIDGGGVNPSEATVQKILEFSRTKN
ncbi:hypothetical protein BH11BAC1_BH11BAC1_19420 [soil metagenome]